MKAIISTFLTVIVVLLAAAPAQAAGTSQIEFVAEIGSIETGPGGSIINLKLTPEFQLAVRVNSATEIKDASNRRIAVTGLAVGDRVKVEGVFVEGGILALEVEITGEQREFEVTGEIQSIDSDRIQVVGFWIVVPAGAEIEDSLGSKLFFTELQVGDRVKVEGNAVGPDLVARQIKRLDASDDFALLRFEGVVTELDGSRMVVELVGGVPALVAITESTEIEGSLAVGTRVFVLGRLNSELITVALRIVALGTFRLAPDEIHLAPGGTGRVDIVLTDVASDDLLFEITSLNPDLATADTPEVVIAAGSLIGSFNVTAGSREGKARIAVVSDDLGEDESLEVEIETHSSDDTPGPGPGDEQELEIKWSPRKVELAPVGPLPVRLVLNQIAPTDLTVILFLKDGDAGLVSFPPEVVIPAGETGVDLTLQILRPTGEAKVRAALPGGGDTDDIDIRLGASAADVKLEWRPDKVELAPGGEATVLLILEHPAPIDFVVTIARREGTSAVVADLPVQVSFAAGQQSAQFVVRAGTVPGKSVFRATAPESLGGDEDDLVVEVKN